MPEEWSSAKQEQASILSSLFPAAHTTWDLCSPGMSSSVPDPR